MNSGSCSQISSSCNCPIRVSSFVAVILHEFLSQEFVLFWKILFSRQPIWPMFHITLHVCGKTYDQTPHNDRFCPVCDSGMIEDEFHFLLRCPKYSIPREKFYNQIQHNFVDLISYLPQNY